MAKKLIEGGIQPGDFILYRHEKGWVGNAIMKAQIKAGINKKDAQYTHIEVSAGGSISVCVAPPKTRVVDIFKRYPGRYIKVVRYAKSTTQRKEAMVAFWAASKCNTKYDWHGVVNFVCSWFKEHFSKWFCSELALWARQKEYPKAIKGMNPRKFMPGHALYYKEWFYVVLEGYIEDKKKGGG